MPDRLAHPLHLVLAALVERQLDPRRAEAADAGRRGLAVLEVDSGDELRDLGVGRLALDVGLVDLVHLVLGMHEPVRELAVVREEERPGRVHVEPADGHDAVFVRHELDDGGPALRILGRRDDARGLVQEDVGERLEADALAVHFNHVPALDEGREPGDLVVHGHAAGLDQVVGPTAGSHSGAR